MTMHYIPGNPVQEGGTLGAHERLLVDNGRDPHTGGRLSWAMEAQTKDIFAPVVRCESWGWSFVADSAADCERAIGPASVNRYEVSNPQSGHSFGAYAAGSARDAIEACARDAGYASIEDMERQLGRPCELVAHPT